jgi:hypothetical protein
MTTRHRGFVSSARFLGAKRWQAMCEDCPFKGELRTDSDAAEDDARMHEAAPAGVPAPRSG